MGRKAGLTRETVIAAAIELADEVGVDQLRLAELATRLGVRPPSLYNHIGGLDDLRKSLALHGARDLADGIAEVVSTERGEDALRAILQRGRAYALEHPGLYWATISVRELPEDDPVRLELRRGVEQLYAVFTDLGIEADRHVAAARILRSVLHGFVSLETGGGFGLPDDPDVSYGLAVDLTVSGLRQLGEGTLPLGSGP